MALLGDQLMSRRPLATLLATGLAVLVAGCTSSSSEPVPAPPASTSASTAGTPSPSSDPLAERAKSAVSGVSVDEEAFVESGVTTVKEGTRNLSSLTEGKRYEAVVACVGTGTVKVTVGSTTARTQNCDGSAVTYRIESAPADLTLVIKGSPGSSGAAAWQINEERGR
ncbi:hypothetical protein [Streptomyces sp. c-19]|uniref:hypothetical protein n=1 Tax=Streptomyces sp. c-19 TaxID=2789275 RepID=UPI00397F25AB